ncbi:MAG: ABC transporter substrate-binding protein [Akkermansia sp.]|nr:ABC transporter substrate-binding protein [Akkermansia sp.]
MKWLRYSLWIAGTAALLLWLAQLASRQQAVAPTAEAVAQPMPPAPYPHDFARQLRRAEGVTIALHREQECPADLDWQSGLPAPPVGCPSAQRGGTLRLSNVGPFPANFLAFGSPSPQFFHYTLFERLEVPLVWEHPATGQEMPGLAAAWCVRGSSIFFRLHPQARYSNGSPVRARDFALGTLLRHRSGCRTGLRELHIYGDSIVEAIPETMNATPALSVSRSLRPAEPGFYAEYSGNYAEHYAQRIPPTTGAYTVAEVQRGRLIALQRLPQWWAEALPGFRHTHNPERIEHHFLADEAQAWEMFFRGRLDMIQTRNIAAWHSKPEGEPAVESGRIALHSLRIHRPMPPYGIAFNTRTLPDAELRRGLMQALDMKSAIDVLFRGYAEQLPQFTSGYRNLPHHTPQYRYNPAEARACFARAGYSEAGADGILRRADGKKLQAKLSYTPSDKLNTLVALLCESAAACGAEIIPEPLPWQNISKQLQEGTHELTFWATMPGLPLPDYERFFHSSSTGHDAPFRLQCPEMDAAIRAVQQAASPREAAAACARVDSLIHREAIWLPGWMENRAQIAAWQHVQLPPNYSGPYEVAESHQLWLTQP